MQHSQPLHFDECQEIVSCVWVFYRACIPMFLDMHKSFVSLGTTRKLIGNTLPISAKVGKAKLAMNLVHIGKISCLCLLSKCLCDVFMVFRTSIRQCILDLLPNQLCQLLQISAKHCRLVSVPPLKSNFVSYKTTHPDSSDQLQRSHITQYHRAYCKLE